MQNNSVAHLIGNPNSPGYTLKGAKGTITHNAPVRRVEIAPYKVGTERNKHVAVTDNWRQHIESTHESLITRKNKAAEVTYPK